MLGSSSCLHPCPDLFEDRGRTSGSKTRPITECHKYTPYPCCITGQRKIIKEIIKMTSKRWRSILPLDT